MTAPETPPRRVSRASIVVGLLVAALVAAAGTALLLARPVQWTATASLLVLPDQGTSDPNELANLYDSLSRGQVPETFAELIRDDRLDRAAAAAVGLSSLEMAGLGLEVEVVPSTSVLDIHVSANSAAVAETVAVEVQDRAVAYLGSLDSPYTAQAVGDPTGTAELDGVSPLVGGALVAAAAVVAGLAAQQAVSGIARARASTGTTQTPLAPVPVTVVNPVAAEPGEVAEPGRRRSSRRRTTG